MGLKGRLAAHDGLSERRIEWRSRGTTPRFVMVSAAAALTVVGAMCVEGCSITRNAAPSSPAASATSTGNITAAGMSSLLLTETEVAQVMDTVTMAAGPVENYFFTEGNIRPQQCAGVYGPIGAVTYGSTHSSAVLAQAMRDQRNRFRRIIQGVVFFPSANEAATVYRQLANDWRACAGRDILSSFDGRAPTKTKVGSPDESAEGIAVDTFNFSASNTLVASCERAMTFSRNSIADVRVCIAGGGSHGLAVTATKQIAAKSMRIP